MAAGITSAAVAAGWSVEASGRRPVAAAAAIAVDVAVAAAAIAAAWRAAAIAAAPVAAAAIPVTCKPQADALYFMA